MKKVILAMVVLMAGGVVHAKKNCTDKPKAQWMSEEAFKNSIKDKYPTINKFKTPGSCYEIYGKNAKGQSVEVYFNPVDGSVVKEKIE